MRYGFIGLGNLGAHLAASLVRAGYEVTVCDLDESRATSLVAGGARWATTPRATAAASDAVITCLPSPAAATAVVAGPDGVLDGLAPGGTWIEMSTTDDVELRRLARLAAARGIATLRRR